MTDSIPRTVSRVLHFENGDAIGISNRWEKGQYCSILTRAGIVGCGIYDLKTPAEFGQAIAIAKGTPANPLTEPEDLFAAPIVATTPQAAALGIRPGMPGREAVELMLKAAPTASSVPVGASIAPNVKSLDHVTLVVADLERSRQFYVEVLGMRQTPRPAFSFAGSWFQAGQTQIHLILEHDRSGPAGNLLPAQSRTTRTQHVAFLVDDAAAVVPFLRERQVPFVGGPMPRPDGWIQVFVTDPDGHVIELCSPPMTA